MSQFLNLDTNDGPYLIPGKRMEDDHVIDAVDKLGAEVSCQRLHHSPLHLRGVTALQVNYGLTAYIGGHDDNCIPEIHCSPLPVRQTPIIEELKQYIEHLLVSFFYFIEKNNAVGPATNRLRQVSPLFVTNISGRSSNETGDGVLFHELRHIDPYHGSIIVKEKVRQRLGKFGFSDPGGPHEDEGADRTVRILESCPCSPYGVGYRLDRFILTYDPLRDSLFHVNQFFHLPFEETAHGDPCPTGNDKGDVLGINLFLEHPLG